MYSEINEKMAAARQGIARRQKIEAQIKLLNNELTMLKNKTLMLQAMMEKADIESDKLEHKSLAAIFYSILGTLDKHIDKEAKEALATRLKYNQAVKDQSDVETQLAALIEERNGFGDDQSEYLKLFAQKTEMLMRDNQASAKRLTELYENIGFTKIKIKETGEAISAGQMVLAGLDRTLECLDSAEDWGTWDIFGGGLLTDLQKHSEIDDAREEIEETQSLLRRFHVELADVAISSDIIVETDGFGQLADVFFDGLLADWSMQTKINDSQTNVSNAREQVASVLYKLENNAASDQQQIKIFQDEINDLVISSI